MNKTFVADLENHFVYLISNGLMSFYINISKKQESTNITIDMKTKKKDDLTKIIGYYEKIDNYNISLVVPIIKLSEENTDFKQQSNEISKIINEAYKILTLNNIEVKKDINVIKRPTRSEFIEFFLKQFSNRVRYITLDDLVHEEVPYNKINAANISFVIGKPEIELTIKDEEMKEIIKDVEELNETPAEKKKVSKLIMATSGYVSYYLLGFLTAVVTLLALTLLVK